jgi:Tfp pilus assembly protein PilE
VSLLIVVLAIVALVYLGTYRDPLYSLHRTEVHQVLKRTAKHGIEYFLKPEVTRRSSAVFRQIEKSIEEEFFVKLKDSCLEQVNNRDWMMWQARNFGDRMLFKEAHYMKLRDCERVRAWDA